MTLLYFFGWLIDVFMNGLLWLLVIALQLIADILNGVNTFGIHGE